MHIRQHLLTLNPVLRETAFGPIVLILLALLFSRASEADEQNRDKVKIDEICYFGYEGLDLEKIKQAVQSKLKAGDSVDARSIYEAKGKKFFKDLETEMDGKTVTDAALVDTGSDHHVLFLGLPGKNNTVSIEYLPVGKNKVQVPIEIEKTYDEYCEEVPLYLLKHEASRKSHMKQLIAQMKVQSKPKRAELRKSLLESSDPNDRAVAAYALGLVAQEQADFDAVTRAARDSNSRVRNNSTSELGDLLQSSPELVSKISEQALEVYADMLNSGTWTDRNKATFIMLDLSKKRDPRALGLLKKKSLSSLKEMVMWPTGYAQPALELIGRIGGISDNRIQKLIAANDVREILNAVK